MGLVSPPNNSKYRLIIKFCFQHLEVSWKTPSLQNQQDQWTESIQSTQNLPDIRSKIWQESLIKDKNKISSQSKVTVPVHILKL